MRIGEIQLGMRENPFLIQVNSELIPTQEFWGQKQALNRPVVGYGLSHMSDKTWILRNWNWYCLQVF
jgi:hypothetical protein